MNPDQILHLAYDIGWGAALGVIAVSILMVLFGKRGL